MGNDKSDYGLVRLVELQGVEQELIRPGARWWDSGGILNINVLVNDIEVIIAGLRALGWYARALPEPYVYPGNVTGVSMIMIGPDDLMLSFQQRQSPPLTGWPDFDGATHIEVGYEMAKDLVAWTDGDAPRTVRTLLAGAPVERVDAFGNRRTLAAGERGHAIEVDGTPVFIEGIDLQLARFRAGFRLEPGFVAAKHRVHEHEIVLSNPWPTTATGTIRLGDGAHWRISPRSVPFTIEPGGSVRLPIDVILGRNLLAGIERVDASVTMLADQPYELEMSTSLEIGLENIEFSARWQVIEDETGERDLVITLVVSNRGETPVRLAAFVIAPEMTLMRRPVGELAPYSTAVRAFRIDGGATRLAGREVRVGLTELNGAARLNKLVQIPAGIGE